MTQWTPRPPTGAIVGAAGLLTVLLLTPASVGAQADPAARDAIIRSAMSAAPEEVSRAATVRDWQAWVDAWQNERPFRTDRMGFGYMLQGDFPTSNTDPSAQEETPDNQWIEDSGPHVMILVPDAAALAGLPRTPHQSGPWVMWDGTPYVHIMLPVPRKP
jgi:hypothetical protein